MTTAAPGWYSDPSGSGAVRWWDGVQWTEHVQQPAQALPGAATEWQQRSAARAMGSGGSPAGDQSAVQAGQAAGQQAGQPAGQPAGPRSPMTEQRLFVSQKRKLIELTNEYAVFGVDGTQIGAVTETGQSSLKKAARLLTSLDQFMTHTVQVNDSQGRMLLALTRPAKVFKSTMVVSGPNGAEIGRLVQRNVFGKIRFGMEVGGTEIGSLNAENWRAWNFAILDHTGTEVARITKTWEGLLTTVFTTADNYLVDIHVPLADPMHSLVVAAALTVDTALKQDSRGWN
ncbi:MAG: scramblase [Actinobacteria bacterium 69-20]|nr:DUF2510 domain-containing protein [Actinomycetota bacterium]OJV29580.1 MAG: scramblase [Actinobacteria bacterium 69-20]